MENNQTLILAIDTSCDDTSASVVKGTTVLANIIASQTQLHKQYGGVFPTVAKQAHKENIKPTIRTALKRAKVEWQDLDALAVTVGPGLAPALEIGVATAKDLAKEHHLALIAVNHIEGHALSALARANSKKRAVIKPVNYPVLSIVISGGHSQFIYFKKIGQYQILGTTIDDAAGECLDKIGRMLNLGYPAGPVIEKFAKLGDQHKYNFPLPMTSVKTFDMSFSGLKTFARNLIQKLSESNKLDKQAIYDLCASAQYAIFRHINYKLSKLLLDTDVKEVWLGGGVAQNTYLRRTIRETIKNTKKKIVFRAPYSKRLCMDNAAMIAVVANFKFKQQQFVDNTQNLDRKPRWKISETK